MPSRPSARALVAVLVLALLGAAACRSAYYKTREQLGTEKREILTERVQRTIGELERVERTLRTAESAAEDLVENEGVPLERRYGTFVEAVETARDHAEELEQAIDGTRRVAADYFREWERSDDDYTDQELREASERRRQAVRQRWDALDASLGRAEASVRPVLTLLGDVERFLEQSLTEDDVETLDPQVDQLGREVRTAAADLGAAEAQANSFLVATRER